MALIENEKYDEASISDQAGTPDHIFEYFLKKFKLPKRWFYDPTIYFPGWLREHNFDALNEDWMSKLIFINHAWSQSHQFLIQIFIQFMLGSNIVVLVDGRALNNIFFLKIMLDFCMVDTIDMM
jgi:hypothetical protein